MITPTRSPSTPHLSPQILCITPPLPPTPQALCNSGVVYRELDRLEEAVAAYEDALAVRDCFFWWGGSMMALEPCC